MTASLLYAVWVLYKGGLMKPFAEFMTNDHLKKIWETGLFDKISIVHSTKAADGQGYFRSMILYYPKNADAWTKYTSDHQPTLGAEYKAKFNIELQDGTMKVDRIMDTEEVLFGE